MDSKLILNQWEIFFQELALLQEEKTELETRLNELDRKIGHIQGIVDHLEPLAGIELVNSVAGLGITDAIRFVLKQAKQEQFSARQILEKLNSHSYDLTGISAPMASIYKILSRLEEANEITRTMDEKKRVFFQWKDPDAITDDDIPF